MTSEIDDFVEAEVDLSGLEPAPTVQEATAGYTQGVNMVVMVAQALGVPTEEIAGTLAINLFDVLAMEQGGPAEGLVVEVRSHGNRVNVRLVAEGQEAAA